MAADFPRTPPEAGVTPQAGAPQPSSSDARHTRRHALPTFEARLVAARTLTPSVRELTFERTDGEPMLFAPGQWVSMLLGDSPEDGRPLKRSYSIASPPAASGSPRFEIAVTRVSGGVGSIRLHDLEPGAVVPMIGPQGFFTRPAAATAPSLMIATGTGVTPMRSMLKATLALGAQAPRAPIWLVLGVRHEEDLLYRDEFCDAVAAHPFVRFEPTLSQPAGSWAGRRGYVQTHVAELWKELGTHAGPGEPVHVYICGLEKMVGSVRSLLRKELGLPRELVHSERYD
jgi:ferredoxin-NADP reductase